ncbi:MAG: hypothetical protein ACX93U_09345 [Salipiger thiooxidans]|uniref:hypothetical protein n=1 Tax=Salipiger thiooxidans TaxID=282683 RepID=UPI001CFAC9DD|nr:hypothetical protein [Salipiger thiooxidans]
MGDFAEQLGVVLGSLAMLITAIGGVAVMKGRKEVRTGEGPSQGAAIKASIDRQTDIMVHAYRRAEEDRERMQRTLDQIHTLAVRHDAKGRG